LIRDRNLNRIGSGERKEIGRIRKVGFLAVSGLNALIRRGNKKPRRGVEIQVAAEIAELDSGNGFGAVKSPGSGQTDSSEGVLGRTGLVRAQQGVKEAG
jgi:hypothetical protein